MHFKTNTLFKIITNQVILKIVVLIIYKIG